MSHIENPSSIRSHAMIKPNAIISVFFFFLSFNCFAQSNVRAWYASGQVFVVWDISLPLEETYAIYASPSPFTNTSSATLIGRPFALEYLGYSLKENLNDANATFRIPDGQGSLYQLKQNEGLFVFTPHQSGSMYFAVTKWGSSTVTMGQNITNHAVNFSYNPLGDPVSCHLQSTFPSPFTTGYVCFAFMMWSDGRQNHWEGRPDFPIMANAAKNGMPGLFLVSVPINLDTTNAFPLSVWMHGGGGNALQSLAGSRKVVNIDPSQGILIAHDDKMYGYRGSTPPHADQPTWHFGWGKNYNPFTPNATLAADTIVNYTQRRYLWIDAWLAKNFNIDTNRINIHGHSMGSSGALAMAKCFPEHYGSATLFNSSFGGPDDGANTYFIFGSHTENFPTNLKNRNNEVVRFYELWNLNINCSSHRDLPLIRHWHGKNDDNGTMHWGPTVIENFIICDSIGMGAQNHWSERPHGIDLAPDYNDHWIMGIPASQQTALDNVDFTEARYHSNESFPAFFNHRLDPKNNNPGTGLIGINNGDGDNWGTWGGYHRWENIVETSQSWKATAWLEGSSIFSNDISPENFLTADIAIRRPQSFKPTFGDMIIWDVKDLSTGNTLQSGTASVQPDDLVVIPQVEVYKENIRKVLISATSVSSSIEEVGNKPSILQIFPNPTKGTIFLNENGEMITIIDLNGMEVKRIKGSIQSQTLDVSYLPNGIYYIFIWMKDGKRKVGKLVKL
ncbi:MAG: T9SS type A sorting domain-containing protein [Saprospiraceae bacterium]